MELQTIRFLIGISRKVELAMPAELPTPDGWHKPMMIIMMIIDEHLYGQAYLFNDLKIYKI